MVLSPAADAPEAVPVVPRRLSRSRRQTQLLDVAAELVVGGGFEAVTMERLAAQAGVSKGLGYAYFENRDHLLATLFDREVGELDRSVLQASEAAGRTGASFEQRMRAIIGAGLDAVAGRGALIGALLRGKSDGGPLDHRRRVRQRNVEDWLASLVVTEYGLSAQRARASAVILLGGYLAAIEHWVQNPGLRAEIVDDFVTLATGGLRALCPAASGHN